MKVNVENRDTIEITNGKQKLIEKSMIYGETSMAKTSMKE